jgi:hydroxypyruvate isomerase
MKTPNRRDALKKMVLGSLALGAAPLLSSFAGENTGEAYKLKGNINHSVCNGPTIFYPWMSCALKQRN